MALGGVVRSCIAFQDALALAKLQKNPRRTTNKPMSKVGELGQSPPKAPAEYWDKDVVPIPFLSFGNLVTVATNGSGILLVQFPGS